METTVIGHVHTPREAPAGFVNADGTPKSGYRRYACSRCEAEWLVLPGTEPGPELQALIDAAARPDARSDDEETSQAAAR